MDAWTCALSNNSPARILEIADLAIFIDTGPELITGPTRLKADTSQKVALNRITTTAMVLCGKVMSNLMVDIQPVN